MTKPSKGVVQLKEAEFPLIDALCLPCGHSNWCLHLALEVLCKHEILADRRRKGMTTHHAIPPELLL